MEDKKRGKEEENIPITANTTIPTGKQQRHAPRPELGKAVAHGLGKGQRYRLLIIIIRRADHLRRIRMRQHVLHPCEIRLVGIGRRLVIWLERGGASGGEGSQRRGPANSEDRLGIEIALELCPGFQLSLVELVLVVGAVGNDFHFELVGGCHCFGSIALQEQLHVGPVVGFAQEVVETNLILARRLNLIVDGAVECAQAEGRYGGLVAYLRESSIAGIGDWLRWLPAALVLVRLERASLRLGTEE